MAHEDLICSANPDVSVNLIRDDDIWFYNRATTNGIEWPIEELPDLIEFLQKIAKLKMVEYDGKQT